MFRVENSNAGRNFQVSLVTRQRIFEYDLSRSKGWIVGRGDILSISRTSLRAAYSVDTPDPILDRSWLGTRY